MQSSVASSLIPRANRHDKCAAIWNTWCGDCSSLLAFPAHFPYHIHEFIVLFHTPFRESMTLLDRFPLLLFQPDYGTDDLYDSPPIVDAFKMVSAYAIISTVNAIIAIAVATGSFAATLFTVFGTLSLIYLTWMILTLVFRFVAQLLGGLGELHNTATFVGLAAAPNVVVAIVSLLITLVRIILLPDNPEEILSKINLGFSLVGMVWGWPGILCYFGLKNAERMSSVKAILVVMPVFFAFAILEVYNSNLFSF